MFVSIVQLSLATSRVFGELRILVLTSVRFPRIWWFLHICSGGSGLFFWGSSHLSEHLYVRLWLSCPSSCSPCRSVFQLDFFNLF